MTSDNNNNNRSLTHQHLKGAECPEDEDRITIRDEVVSGFLARVYPSGKKSFHVRYRIHGKHKCPKIGGFSQMSLKDARKKAMEMKVEVSQGNDPMRETADDFEDLVDEYMENHFTTLAESTQRDTKRNINQHILPVLGSKSPDKITTNDIRDLTRTMHE